MLTIIVCELEELDVCEFDLSPEVGEVGRFIAFNFISRTVLISLHVYI